MLFVILLLFFISFPGYSTMSPAFHPSLSGPWRPPPALSSTPTTFDCLFFFIYREHYSFEWHFLPTGVFYLTLLPDIFGTTCFYQGLPGSQQFFLEVFRVPYWSSKHRPDPSVCLIYCNLQSFIHLKFVFIHVNIAKFYLWWKLW